MAMSFLGRAGETVPPPLQDDDGDVVAGSLYYLRSYLEHVMQWQRCVQDRGIQFVVVPGVHIQHCWHGSLRHRRYVERWSILQKHMYDPATFLKYDPITELYVWDEERCPPGLVQDIQLYFEQRQEDSMEALEDDSIYNKPNNRPKPKRKKKKKDDDADDDDNNSSDSGIGVVYADDSDDGSSCGGGDGGGSNGGGGGGGDGETTLGMAAVGAAFLVATNDLWPELAPNDAAASEAEAAAAIADDLGGVAPSPDPFSFYG